MKRVSRVRGSLALAKNKKPLLCYSEGAYSLTEFDFLSWFFSYFSIIIFLVALNSPAPRR